eukprot:304087-Heterocapsa_arctica.AAC.1
MLPSSLGSTTLPATHRPGPRGSLRRPPTHPQPRCHQDRSGRARTTYRSMDPVQSRLSARHSP